MLPNEDELFKKIVKPDKYYQHCYFMQYTVCKAYNILSNTVSRHHQICLVLKYLKSLKKDLEANNNKPTMTSWPEGID